MLKKLSVVACGVGMVLGVVGCSGRDVPVPITTSTPVVSTVSVTVTGPATVNVGSVGQYVAVASGSTPQAFTWQVNGVTGGNSTYGLISATGVYTPPTNVPTANTLSITAVSTYATGASGSAQVTVFNYVPVIASAVATTTTFGQSYLLDVTGNNFANGASLTAGGTVLATTAVSSTRLQATVTPATTVLQTVSVAVQNPGPGATLSQNATVTLNPNPPPTNQEEWITDISAANESPALALAGDPHLSWTAPDGRVVQLTVNAPHPAATAPTVTLGAYTAGNDATPVFNAAISKVQQQGAGKLIIPKATYTFKTLGPTSQGHFEISGVTDVVIEGSGSTFVFTQPAYNGVYMYTSQRVQLQNVVIDWATPTLMYYTAKMTVDPTTQLNVLTVDPAYQAQVTAADTIGNIGEYDTTTNLYALGGSKAYLPAVTYNAATHSYASSAFQGNLYTGKSYMVYEHYYQGTGIKIQDTWGPQQSHDIILDHITINSGPGMGIIAYGLKRGLVVSNSQIVPAAGSLVSTEYDGLNMQLVGGDVYIHDNLITRQGDDAMNFNNPVTPIVSVDSTGLNPTLSTYSRFIQKNDLLSFFDATNTFVGTAYAVSAPVALGGLNYTVKLSNPIPGLSTAMVVRDMDIVNNRTAFVNNTVQNCRCHGILMQTPNALVQGNTFSNTVANPVRLLSNIGTFLEGTGAINVLVQGNTLSMAGADSGIHAMPWAALSLYAANASGVNAVVSNKWVNILNNTITSANQGCLSVVASETVKVMGNTCNSTNLSPHGVPSIQVVTSNDVVFSGNSRTGTTTGDIVVDAVSTNVTKQGSY